ncbi:hypothetical protein [Thalassomonas haliotis]|uniref:Uncharacterized protein n=1 Tax=Thalassomonas haliotis TaxID=485448 RepID=A0ABY7VD17_9GAMM|nr:hypothetical protein [Thalassomonas haliotis]WDE11287.1 hypothetical protein H3N35_24195 [Thalassomonas haliotis]
MKLFFGLIISLLSLSPAAQAETIVLFDADKQCHSRETGKGIRYTPPCSLTETEFVFTLAEDNTRDIKTSAGTQKLDLNFHCESLRPLSIEYQISQQANIITSGKLAPTQNNHNAHSSLSMSEPAGDYRLTLLKINGMKGFQAIKPGCRLTLELGKKAAADLAVITAS